MHVTFMLFYILFAINLVLLLWRFFRSRKFGERTVLTALFLLLLLTAASHKGLIRMSGTFSVLEKLALFITFFWLIGGPLFFWMEQRRRRRSMFQMLRNGLGPFAEILSACRMLSEAGRGALIAIQRNQSLQSWVDSGIPLDAQIRRETLFSLFTPPGALHDGGIVIRGERIAAGGVVFPLSKRLDLPTELGTRHRAALGLSEATDALVLVLSEETGKISLTDQGRLFYDVEVKTLPQVFERALRKRLMKAKTKKRPPVLGTTHELSPQLRTPVAL